VSWLPEVEEIHRRASLAKRMGGTERVDRQHAQGRLTVRERIAEMVDPGSFVEVGELAGSGVYVDGILEDFTPAPYVGGMATVDGRVVAIGGEDFTVKGGSAQGPGGTKSQWHRKLALHYKIPVIDFIDGVGANIQAMETQRRAYLVNGNVWAAQIDIMKYVPVMAGLMGSIAGGPAAMAVMNHFNCMPKTADLYAAGPPVIRRAIGRDISKQELGGTKVHVYQSGVADNEAEDEHDCIRQLKRFFSYMPRNVWELPPYVQPDDKPDRKEEELLSIIPRQRNRAYDMKRLIQLVMDRDSWFEIKPHYGRCIITGLARLNGHVVAVLANNPLVQGGALDAKGSEKMARFLEFADCFHIPVVNFVDVPGFMVGPQAELDGTLRYGMRALWVAHQVTVPVNVVCVRRLYGMAGVATGTPLGLRLCWPSGEWGSLPIEGGVDAAYRREIENAPDPDAKREEIEERIRALRSVFTTAEAFGMEHLIDPRDTRQMLIKYLEAVIPIVKNELGPKMKVVGVRP
jgi:acetyl-CoA carboxylase carboxyltransferase component